MPLWSQVEEIGLLIREAGQLILMKDDGGQWRLDTNNLPTAYLASRVRVTGVRSGFDLIDVHAIQPVTEALPSKISLGC